MLSLKPCCADNDCQGDKFATKELSGKSPIKEKECHGCSPFFTCGTCIGFIIAKRFTLNLKPTGENRVTIYADYQQPYVQKVSLSIWQPPQLS